MDSLNFLMTETVMVSSDSGVKTFFIHHFQNSETSEFIKIYEPEDEDVADESAVNESVT